MVSKVLGVLGVCDDKDVIVYSCIIKNCPLSTVTLGLATTATDCVFTEHEQSDTWRDSFTNRWLTDRRTDQPSNNWEFGIQSHFATYQRKKRYFYNMASCRVMIVMIKMFAIICTIVEINDVAVGWHAINNATKKKKKKKTWPECSTSTFSFQ